MEKHLDKVLRELVSNIQMIKSSWSDDILIDKDMK